MRAGGWTRAELHALYRLWVIDGRSSGFIANLLPRRNRNAVMGKAHRRGWVQGSGYSPKTAPQDFPVPEDWQAPEPPPLKVGPLPPPPAPQEMPKPIRLAINNPNICATAGCRGPRQPGRDHCAECLSARHREKDEAKKRKCLMCGDTFMSSHSGERACRKCQATKNFRVGA